MVLRSDEFKNWDSLPKLLSIYLPYSFEINSHCLGAMIVKAKGALRSGWSN
jgi:hypothetical protein